MKTPKTIKSLLFAVAALSAMAFQNASASSYSFGVPLNGQSPMPSATFATLDVNDLGSNVYRFKLESGDLNSIFYTGAFITDLLINTAPSVTSASVVSGSLKSGIVGSTTDSGAVFSIGIASAPNMGSTSWNFNLSYPETGRNGGSRRFTGNEWAMWDVAFNSPLIFEVPEFGLHVQNLNSKGDSGWYGPDNPPAVPLPAAAWLFGSALFGFMVVSNRRKV